MPSNLRVLQRKPFDLVPIQVIQDPGVNLAGELASAAAIVSVTHLVEELFQQLDVDEHGAGVRKLLGDDSQEGLRAERGLVRAGLATFRADSMLTGLQKRQPVL